MTGPGLERLEELVRGIFRGTGGCHDFDHTLRVRRNALAISGQLSGVDVDVVEAGALLHDIGRSAEDAARGGGVCHAEAGAAMARELLKREGYGEEFALRVSRVVGSHRYRGGEKPDTPEGAVVYDADKLDSLGAVGIGRAFLFAGACGAKLHNSTEEALRGVPYGRDDTAWREFLVKLRYLPGAMLTEPGRRLAEERFRVMEEFFKELISETGIS